jgi:hypothetical protein
MSDASAAALRAQVLEDFPDLSDDILAILMAAAEEAGSFEYAELLCSQTFCQHLGLDYDASTPPEFNSTPEMEAATGADVPVDGFTRAHANNMSWGEWVVHAANHGWLMQHKEAWVKAVSITVPQFMVLLGYNSSQLKGLVSYHANYFLKHQALPTKDRAREVNIDPLLTAFPGLQTYMKPSTHSTCAVWFTQPVVYTNPQTKAFKCVLKPLSQWYESQDAADRDYAWKIEGHNVTPVGQILSFLFNSPAFALEPNSPNPKPLGAARKQVAATLRDLVSQHKDIGDLFGLQLVSDYLQSQVLIPLAKAATKEIDEDPAVAAQGTSDVANLKASAANGCITFHTVIKDIVPPITQFVDAAYNYFCDNNNPNFAAMFMLSARVQSIKHGINPQLAFRKPNGQIGYRPEFPQGQELGLRQLYEQGKEIPAVGQRTGSGIEFATPTFPALPAPTTPTPYPQQSNDQLVMLTGDSFRGGFRNGRGHRGGRGYRHNNYNSGSYGSYEGSSTFQAGPSRGGFGRRGGSAFHPYGGGRGGSGRGGGGRGGRGGRNAYSHGY